MVETVREVLGWSTLLNWGVLALWFGTLLVAHDGLQALHGRWFSIDPERFDEIHYGMMGMYKILILLLNLVPYLALRIAA